MERDEPIIIPRIEEDLSVGRKRIETAQVRLRKSVKSETVTMDVPSSRTDVQIRRVAKDLCVTEAPQIRQEGDELVIPVVEEQWVLKKQMILKEEIRVSQIRSESLHSETIQLRKEQIEVLRTDFDKSSDDESSHAEGNTQTRMKLGSETDTDAES